MSHKEKNVETKRETFWKQVSLNFDVLFPKTFLEVLTLLREAVAKGT